MVLRLEKAKFRPILGKNDRCWIAIIISLFANQLFSFHGGWTGEGKGPRGRKCERGISANFGFFGKKTSTFGPMP